MALYCGLQEKTAFCRFVRLTFSFFLLFYNDSAVMEAVDFKYRYRFERPEGITWEMWDKARAEAGERLQDILEIRCKPDYSDYEDLRQHCLMEETCRILGIVCYTRWER